MLNLPYGSHPGIPVANVKVAHQRISAFTPTNGELYWSVNESASSDGSINAQTFGANISPELGCAGPTVNFIDRDNYLVGISTDASESPIYGDSNPIKEQGWRTFIASKPFFLNEEQGDVYISPSVPSAGTTTVSTTTSDSTTNDEDTTEDTSTDDSTTVVGTEVYNQIEDYAKRQGAEYKYESNTFTGTNLNTIIYQSISQVNGGKTPGTLIQQTPFHQQQEFRIKFKIHKPTIISNTNQWDIIAGTNGPFLIFEFGEPGTPRFALVFPYNQIPYMVKVADNGDLQPETNSFAPEDWILNEGQQFYEFHFCPMKNKIVINKIGGSTFSYPPNEIAENQMGTEIYNRLKEGAFNNPNGIYLSSCPIKVHHRGLRFTFHITPAEFIYNGTTYYDSNGQIQTVSLGHDCYVDSPPILMSEEQYIDKLTIEGANVPAYSVMLPSGAYNNQVGIEVDPSFAFMTGCGIPVSASLTLFPIMLPARYIEYLMSNNSAYKAIDTSDSGFISHMIAYKIRAVFRPTQPLTDSPPSSSYFRTKLYSIRTIVRCKYLGIGKGTDISNYVKRINYNYTNEGHTFIRKDFTLECLVPKEASRNVDIPRTMETTSGLSWEKIQRNPVVIKIGLGWENGDRYRSFTGKTKTDNVFLGIGRSGGMKFTHNEDTLTLNCSDLFSILEKSFILNSPYYDGMCAPLAIGTLLDKAGFHSLGSSLKPEGWFNISTEYGNPYRWTLPYSGLFTSPLVKFENGTSYKDAIKQVLNRFWLLMFCHDNKFIVTDVPGTVYGLPNNLSVTSKLGYGDPAENYFYSIDENNTNNNIYKIVIKERETTVDTSQQVNIASVTAVDAFTGNIISVTRSDIDSIMDEDAENFTGHLQMWFSQKSALGSKQDTQLLLNRIFPYISQPKTEIRFKVWGQDYIYPGDIISLDNNKMRVTQVSGVVERGPEHWTITVTGEHYGTWNPDIDTSNPNL